jgi:putative endonuclease
MMASRRNGTLYIGVTRDLVGRVFGHRESLVPGFTKRYGCKLLMWFELHDDLQNARQRELQMKEWRRAWKIELIQKSNPGWDDLYPGLMA